MTGEPTLTLVGYGKMARAIALGLNGLYPLEIAGRDLKKIHAFIEANQLQAESLPFNETLPIDKKHLILCVKPHALEKIKTQGKAASLYSILAGTKLEKLKATLSADSYVRAMPNIAAAFSASFTTLCGDEAQRESAEKIFGAIGKTLWFDLESKIEVATAIAGSGPAYLALIAQSLSDAGVREGLSREESRQITLGLFEGFSKLLAQKTAQDIQEEVTSPNGTTAEGLAILESKAIRGSFIEAIHAALIKAKNFHS